MKRIFREGSSARHVVTLMTGTALAQAIPVAISPLLSRLYTPADIGVLALFTALSNIPSAVASGRYELAIQLAKDDEEAINVAALSLVVAVAVAVILLLIVMISGQRIAELTGNKEIGPWLYLVPISVLLSAIFTILNYLNTRANRFSDVAKAGVLKSVVLGALQLGGGALKAGATGLIVGQVASMFAANGRLFRNATQGRNISAIVSRQRMKQVAHQHSRLPKFIMGSTLANAFANNFTGVLISSFYSTTTLGFYALGQRALSAPMQLIGNAVGQVFFQRASQARNRTGSAYKVMKQARNALLAFSLAIFVPLYFVVEPLFAFIFGEQWRTAGQYARLLIPVIAVRFAASPLALMYHVNEQFVAHLLFNLALLASVVLVIFGCGMNGVAPERMFMTLSIVNATLYACLLWSMERTARRLDRAVGAQGAPL
ncbi:MAG: lipopolysaccharide biosynthesis protein [Luteimonas sp.]